MIRSIIVAVTDNLVIGKDNDLPWHLPKDLKYFKDVTEGHHVIMGRKNFETIPDKYRPLSNRTNIILTRDESYSARGCIIEHSLKDALDFALTNGEDEVFIIGGGEIYKLALEEGLVDRMYITEIRTQVDGDTYFPAFDKSYWIETSRVSNLPDERNPFAFDFVTYERK